MSSPPPTASRLRLEIAPVIRNAESLHQQIRTTLPTHPGLANLALGVAEAARTAENVSRNLQRPFGLHRLPALFLAAALVVFLGWIYVHFLSVTRLTIALPDRDADELRSRVSSNQRVHFEPVVVRGSREAVELVSRRAVDLAFVQGGLPLSDALPRLETPAPEVILWMLRESVADISKVRTILTSLSGEGSHSVCLEFLKAWDVRHEVAFVHDWKRLTDEENAAVPDEVDAVFVVKDPSDELTLRACSRLARAGFRLVSPDIGARATRLKYLSPETLGAGFLQSIPPFPPASLETYQVATYLVARENLTPRLLGLAARLIDKRPASIALQGFEATIDETSEVFQGVDAMISILINIVLAFFALMGFEMLAYRKRFHELNSLVSLISMHQSSKDVVDVPDPRQRHENLLYLSLCSDLLGLVSAISGYYTQENSSLLFNSLPEIIHQRCDGLKINIQLKILHSMIPALHAGIATAGPQSPHSP